MTFAFGTLLVIAATATAILGLVVVRRLVSIEDLQANHQVGSIIFGVVGTAYAVLLSFVIVITWQLLTAADQRVTAEAGNLGSLYWIASGFPAQQSQPVHEAIANYAQVAIDEEWPLMARGQASDKAWLLHDALWKAVFDLRPASTEQAQLYGSQYSQALSEMAAFDQSRRARLLTAKEAIPWPLWVVLIGAGAILVPFTYLFGIKRIFPQILMTGTLAVLVSMSLVLAAVLDRRYAGDVRVAPTALQSVLGLAQTSVRAPLSGP
jgi:Protein of unknown function (DUF4239)